MTDNQIDTRTNRPLNQTSFGGGGAHFADIPLALKRTVVGAITYVAEAEPGSAESAAVWRVFRTDTTTGTRTTWADGNGKPDNVATDLTTLTYS